MKAKKLIYPLCITLLVILLIAQWLHNRKVESQHESALASMKLSETILTRQRDDLGREVSTFRATQLTMAQLDHIADSGIMIMKKELKYWKNLASHTEVRSTTSDTIETTVHDTVYRDRDSVIHARTFSYRDEWLSLNGILLTNNVKLNYSVFNNISVDYYWKKDGWFSRKYLAGSVTQSNPHTTTDRVIQFTVISPPVPWYGKWWVHDLIGIGVGSAMTYFILK